MSDKKSKTSKTCNTCKNKITNLKGGSSPIPTQIDSSPGWHYRGQKIDYAVDATAGINDYVFGRTTPNNSFIVASGLAKHDGQIELTGAGKAKKPKAAKPKAGKPKAKKPKAKKPVAKKPKAKKPAAKKPKEKK
jgi:hypothetical protein